jgi:hypothetical protein
MIFVMTERCEWTAHGGRSNNDEGGGEERRSETRTTEANPITMASKSEDRNTSGDDGEWNTKSHAPRVNA